MNYNIRLFGKFEKIIKKARSKFKKPRQIASDFHKSQKQRSQIAIDFAEISERTWNIVMNMRFSQIAEPYPLRVDSMYASISDLYQRSLRPILNGLGKFIFSSLSHLLIVHLSTLRCLTNSFILKLSFEPSIIMPLCNTAYCSIYNFPFKRNHKVVY